MSLRRIKPFNSGVMLPLIVWLGKAKEKKNDEKKFVPCPFILCDLFIKYSVHATPILTTTHNKNSLTLSSFVQPVLC